MTNSILPPPKGNQKSQAIKIVISYEWGRADGNNEVVPVRQQTRWLWLRDLVSRNAESVKLKGQKAPGTTKLQVEICRLRGTHGMALLPLLRSRIAEAEILIADLGSDGASGQLNHNVLVELGMALQTDKYISGGIFVLKPANAPSPSDLNGILLTEYNRLVITKNIRAPKKQYKIIDEIGFNAALKSKIVKVARERGMIGAPKTPEIIVEDNPGA